MGQEKWRVEKTRMKDRSAQAGHWPQEQQRERKWLEEVSEREEEGWKATDGITARVHPLPQSARSSHFPPFHHLWPSQKCKTTNNITTLTWCTTEPVTRVYVGLITAWSSSSDYQGRRLKCFSRLCCGLVCASSRNLDLERSAQESWWRCSVTSGRSCWPLKSERSLNFIQHKREKRRYNVI